MALSLETKRLIIRPFKDSDVESLFAYRNDPEAVKYQGWEFPYPRERAISWITNPEVFVPTEPGSRLKTALELKSTGEMIGTVAQAIPRTLLSGEKQMIKKIIFDLSDVLITGLTGIEEKLPAHLSAPKDGILRQFRGNTMLEFLLGYCSEEEYLQELRLEHGWELGVEELKKSIREHFKKVIPGAEEIVTGLADHYALFLLSDHGREWIEYIEREHAFLKLFKSRFYSFEMHMRKNNPDTYRKVLNQIDAIPEECLFIDDRPMFLDVAKEVGLNTIQFENSSQLRTALARYSITI